MRLRMVCALLGLVGCTADAPVDHAAVDWASPPALAPQIKDGFDDPDDTAVMAVTSFGGGGAGLCSSSLIAPNVLMSSRHCVSGTTTGASVSCGNTEFQGLAGAASLFVSSAAAIDAGNAGEFLVAEVVLLAGMPGIPASVEDDDPFCGNDLVLLILQENVPESVAVPYVPWLEGSLEVGLAYYAVGYGAINGQGEEAGTRRRRDDLAVVCDGEAACDLAEIGGVVDGEWSGNGGVCSGDSGGPALDLENRVVGVTSRGDDACDISVYANPSAHAQWIKDATVFASGMGVYDAPAWTEGATVNPQHSMPVGDLCDSGEDCPTGICVMENGRQYCSRPCCEEDCSEEGPCPEGYDCIGDGGGDGGDAICKQHQETPPPKFKRAPKDDCAYAAGSQPGDSAWLMFGLGLMFLSRRRFLSGR